jgi:uncharacterized protein (DUF1800 family)
MRTRVAVALGFPLFLTGIVHLSAGAGPFSEPLSQDDRVRQVLNRLTFGPRPSDFEQVKAMGLKRWIDLQLHPERIPENPELEARLAPLHTLTASSEELLRSRPKPGAQRGNRRDPEMSLSPQDEQILQSGTPEQRLRVLQRLAPAARRNAWAAIPQEQRQEILAAATPDMRDQFFLSINPDQRISSELTEAKLLRAVYSNRQLDEVLADFWVNHFNVFINKGADRFLLPEFEREAIRPHMYGKFRDLLEATAKSPAMLFYLDNWTSVAPEKMPTGRSAKARRGLNENYGRELMELHTLGVDGGYTQHDVTEVARCFTGWTIERPQQDATFRFNPRVHDDGVKTVLGKKIKAGGIRDGEEVLDILARHPSTAHFISWKLAQRFVADEPPPALVDRMAHTFLKTDGDLRQVMRIMFDSPEFWSKGAYMAKVKSPLELVVSSVRVSGAQVQNALPLTRQVAQLGEPLYQKREPTGYSNAGREWMNSASLVARMNFALAFSANRMPGVRIEDTAEPHSEAAVIGSPEFQKH